MASGLAHRLPSRSSSQDTARYRRQKESGYFERITSTTTAKNLKTKKEVFYAISKTDERREGKAFINTEILQREETGFTGEAAERLAAFEDVYEHLLQSQETLSAKLEELRSEGKTRSHQFKEAMEKSS